MINYQRVNSCPMLPMRMEFWSSPVTTSHLGGRACRNGHQILCDLPRRDLCDVRGDLGVSQKVGGSYTMSILAKFTGGFFLSSPTVGIRNLVLSVLLQPAKVAQQPMHLGTRYSVFQPLKVAQGRKRNYSRCCFAICLSTFTQLKWPRRYMQKVSQKTSKRLNKCLFRKRNDEDNLQKPGSAPAKSTVQQNFRQWPGTTSRLQRFHPEIYLEGDLMVHYFTHRPSKCMKKMGTIWLYKYTYASGLFLMGTWRV